MLTFKPYQVTTKFLKVVNGRTRDVLEKRYGLGADTETHTLESIGRTYGITRERVRQIENHGMQTIQKSSLYNELTHVFDELHRILDEQGVIVDEAMLLEKVAPKQAHRNHVFFLLSLGHSFTRVKEDQSFKNRWHIDHSVASAIEKGLQKIHGSLEADELIAETDILMRLKAEIEQLGVKYHTPERLFNFLQISKKVGRNQLGDWGNAESSNIRTKGVRDYAYLVVKRHGSPMHFREVSEAIVDVFNRTAHVATTHNELIKDKRFVLVGRGLYALTEWGYTQGVVKDVIQAILREHGELSREEIIDLVRKERYVKDNTIMVNLQDGALFKRTASGTYVALD